MAPLIGNPDIITASESGVLTSRAKKRQVGTAKTCERCKSLHLKCIYPATTTICQRCTKSGHDCVQQSKTKFRFRKTWVPSYHASQSHTSGQTGSPDPITTITEEVGTSNELVKDHDGREVEGPTANTTVSRPFTNHSDHAEYSWADTEDADHSSAGTNLLNEYSRNHYGEHEPQETPPTFERTSLVRQSQTGDLPDPFSPERARTASQPSYMPYAFSTPRMTGERTSNTLISPGTRTALLEDPNVHYRRLSSDMFLDDLVKAPCEEMSNDSRKALETHLIRYFVDNLAPWFDICDPCRHFAHVLPQRARASGPLRSALLTIAARDLSRARNIQSSLEFSHRKVDWLPGVTEELAMSYHNDCISELLSLSLCPGKLHDETLLAAVILLRTDEEMLHVEKDQQLFLRIASLFIDAQLPLSLEILRLTPQLHFDRPTEHNLASSPLDIDFALNSDSLRQACFWTALRQDLHAAFLKQQPVSFPLKRCGTFRLLLPASDAVWAHRMVVFCADVVEYCFGSESVDGIVQPAYMDRIRWQKLQAYKQEMCALLPSSFEPLYCSEPDNSRGEVFPSILYLEPAHVSGTTYIELATMLLETYNPVRSKLAGALLHPSRAFLGSIKKILFRLCGTAMSNAQMCPPGLVNASLGIGLFGEFFEGSEEQNALLSVLSLMTQTFNYHPATQIAKLLRRTWFETSDDEPFAIATAQST